MPSSPESRGQTSLHVIVNGGLFRFVSELDSTALFGNVACSNGLGRKVHQRQPGSNRRTGIRPQAAHIVELERALVMRQMKGIPVHQVINHVLLEPGTEQSG